MELIDFSIYPASDVQYGGYIGQIPGMAYESMRIKDVTDAGQISDFAGLLWPHGNPAFW